MKYFVEVEVYNETYAHKKRRVKKSTKMLHISNAKLLNPRLLGFCKLVLKIKVAKKAVLTKWYQDKKFEFEISCIVGQSTAVSKKSTQ